MWYVNAVMYIIVIIWNALEICSTGMIIRRRKGKIRMSAEGAQKLLDACKEIVKDNGITLHTLLRMHRCEKKFIL